MKVGEGGHLVGGLEERENGSESAGSDPAPRLVWGAWGRWSQSGLGKEMVERMCGDTG